MSRSKNEIFKRIFGMMDYFVKDVGDSWIVFPHEIEGLSDDEVVRKDPALADLIASCVK